MSSKQKKSKKEKLKDLKPTGSTNPDLEMEQFIKDLQELQRLQNLNYRLEHDRDNMQHCFKGLNDVSRHQRRIIELQKKFRQYLLLTDVAQTHLQQHEESFELDLANLTFELYKNRILCFMKLESTTLLPYIATIEFYFQRMATEYSLTL